MNVMVEQLEATPITTPPAIAEAEPNAVIQINPHCCMNLGGCLMMVDQVHDWGLLCHTVIPARPGEQAQRGPAHRITHGQYRVVGQAPWPK